MRSQFASDLLQLPIRVCLGDIYLGPGPGSQPVCRITQGAGSLPCALRITASQHVRPHIVLTIRLLVCVNYRDRVLFPKPWEVRD
jgi:hypothetical protein